MAYTGVRVPGGRGWVADGCPEVEVIMKDLTVNRAMWDAPSGIPDGWLIVNAPRPLLGEVTWTGEFRHGVFYAASPEEHTGIFGWEADDAWRVRFTDNAAIEAVVLAKFAEYGYGSADDAGVTVAEQAECMGLPWFEG